MAMGLAGRPGAEDFSLPRSIFGDSFYAIPFNQVVNPGGLPPPTCEVAMLKRVVRYWPVVAVVLLIGLVASCSWLSPFPPSWMADRETHPVEIGGSAEAATFNPDPVRASPLDFVHWSHSLPQTVVIELEGVPVTPPRLVLPEGVSGQAMVLGNAREGEYKYVVKVVLSVGDTVTIDPHIIVEPKR